LPRTRPEAGTAIILRPCTGEILALANWPTFNPNAFSAADPVARRSRAVQDYYEPGSTFKVVTASAAIEEASFTSDPIDCSPGYITFGPRVIRDTHDAVSCRSSTSSRNRATSARSRSA
jgi:cell division protein FtsI (penicillin-binding protein 3)